LTDAAAVTVAAVATGDAFVFNVTGVVAPGLGVDDVVETLDKLDAGDVAPVPPLDTFAVN